MNIKPNQMHDQSVNAERLLKAVANRHRLMILCQLVEGPQPVHRLAEFLDLRDSTVSQHLTLLRKDGLVSTRRDGQTIWYSLVSEPGRRLVETLYDIYCNQGNKCSTKPKRRQSKR